MTWRRNGLLPSGAATLSCTVDLFKAVQFKAAHVDNDGARAHASKKITPNLLDIPEDTHR
jgi:hypothetical protein